MSCLSGLSVICLVCLGCSAHGRNTLEQNPACSLQACMFSSLLAANLHTKPRAFVLLQIHVVLKGFGQLGCCFKNHTTKCCQHCVHLLYIGSIFSDKPSFFTGKMVHEYTDFHGVKGVRIHALFSLCLLIKRHCVHNKSKELALI